MSDSNKNSLFCKQIIGLIINIGTDNLRECLYSEVGKSNINERLRSEEVVAEFRLLRTRNCITEEEFDQLTRNPNPDTYDISLLMLLLANSKVCYIPQPLNGWIKSPSDSDLSIGADLVRLREIRNEIIDQEYIVNMSETHFEGLWVQIKHIFTRIASRRGTDAEHNMKLKVKKEKMAKKVQDDNALDKFIHWYEQDTKEYQQCLLDVQDSLKDLHMKVDNSSQPLDEQTFKTDHESLQSKVKRILGSFRLSAQRVFEIVSCGTVDTVRYALPYLDDTVELITEAYDSIIKRWKEFKLFCNSVLPPVILKMDEKSIEIYKKALAEGFVPDHGIRLMIVGHVGVGKTTLKRRLFEESVNIEERVSTKGIDVHVGRCRIDMTSNNWIIEENDCRIEAVYQQLAGLLSLQESPSNPSNSTEDQFERNDNERVKLPTSNVNAHSEDHPSLNLEKELPIEQTKQSNPQLLKMQDERKDNDANQNKNNMDKDSCLADLKEILNQSSKLDKNQQKAELSIWDFAGQSDFYAMHQVFLSRHAVYLLVTKLHEHIHNNVEDDRDCKITKNLKIIEYIEFWLNSIYEYTQHEEIQSRARSNVILVGTFADKIKEDCKEGSNQDFFDTVRVSLCEKVTFDSLTEDSFCIDNTIDLTDQASKIPDLRKYILETASKQSYWGQKIPAKWCTLINVLFKLQDKGTKVLTKTAIVDLTKALPVEMLLDEIELFLNFHHESGNIIYYSHEDQLKETIILQPQWLIDALKSLKTAKSFCCKMKDTAKLWDVFEKTAVLQKQLIDAIWNQEKYSEFRQQSTLILLFMEKLGLIARPYQSVHQEGIKGTNEYLVPHFLKEHIPMAVLKNNGKSTSKLCVTTPTGFLPKTIFYKLLAVCIREFQLSGPTERKHIYCDGGVFDLENGHQLFVCFYDNVIHIWLTRLSAGDHDVDESISLRISTFVLDVLKKDVHEVVKSFKCRSSSIESTFKLKAKTLQLDQEVICYCQEHGRGHHVETLELMKYWKRDTQHTIVDGQQLPEISNKSGISGQPFRKEFDNTLSEAIMEILTEQMKSVGVLMSGDDMVGTVFRIGKTCIMTALHVVRHIIIDCGDTLEDEQIYVHFHKSRMIGKPNQSVDIFYLKKDFIWNEDLDVAILEISNPQKLPSKMRLSCSETDLSDVSLIGYGNPNNEHRKVLDPRCKIEYHQSERMQSVFSWLKQKKSVLRTNLGKHSELIDVGYQGYDHPSVLLFDCIITHGASGAPILSNNNERSVAVVGVLTRGLPEFYFKLPDQVQKDVPHYCKLEMGAKMKCIYDWIIESHPEYVQEFFS